MDTFQLAEPKALLLLATLPVVVALGLLSARARPRDRARIRVSVVIRSLILILLALALAGLQWVTTGGPLSLVFLLDESASVSQGSRDAAYDYVRQALQAMGPDDRAGIVLFGDHAVVARAVSGDREFQPFGDHPATTATNIAEAIQAGVALLPEGGSRRLVLLTDGAETIGEAREHARLAGLAGVQVSVVPIGGESQNEVGVDRVVSPETIPAGQRFDVQVLLSSTSERSVTVRLFDNDQPVGEQTAQLREGNNAVRFNVKPDLEGLHVFKASVSATDDRYAENNEATSFTMLRKPPSVLIVAGSPADGEPLQAALEASDIVASVVSPDAMPRREENLIEYDAVVLANASAEKIGADGQQLLQRYVRDLGRGLVMLGGESSYGAGGYLRSPIEEVLPVTMDVRTTEQRSSLALAFVTDKSGSMGRCHCGGAQSFNPSMRTEFGVSKVEIAKQAIAKASAVLNSTDQVGVVGFDEAPHWLINMQPLAALSGGKLEADLKPVTAEGNTNMFVGLQAAVDELKRTDAKLKHIILLSDGWTRQGDFTALLNEMDAQNVTLSTVGAGQGSADVLRTLADRGGGRFYAAEDVSTIPDVFLRETVRLAGSYYVEQPFKPLLTKVSPITKGLDAAGLPRLLGYNGSTLKPAAELILKSPDGDPILAQWQYGLGRSVAWTPDVKGRWATDWVTWPQFSQFAGQMVGWTLPRAASPGLESTFTAAGSQSAEGQDVGVRIESNDIAGVPRNFLSTSLVITATDGTTATAPVFQQSPGIYGGVIKGLMQGVYEVRIEQREVPSGKLVASELTGLIVPYPSEFRVAIGGTAEADALLRDVAQLAGGKELSLQQPTQALIHDIITQPRAVPLWPALLTFSALLFPLDVAVRRLSIGRADWRRARAALRLRRRKT